MEIKTEILDIYTRRVNKLLKRHNNQKIFIIIFGHESVDDDRIITLKEYI